MSAERLVVFLITDRALIPSAYFDILLICVHDVYHLW